jgi:hypothetical protein
MLPHPLAYVVLACQCIAAHTVLHCCFVFMCRPYGVSSLLAVHYKAAGPQLYLVHPLPPSDICTALLFLCAGRMVCRLCWQYTTRQQGRSCTW